MEWMEFIVSMTEALAWPLTLCVVLYLVRDKLSHLVDRLLIVKHKDTEIQFTKTMAEIEDKALALPVETKMIEPELTRLRRMAEIVPRAAVNQAWCIVDTEVCNIIVESDTKPDNMRSFTQAEVVSLLKHFGLSSEDIRSIKQLRSAWRAQLERENTIVMSGEEIDAYIDLSASVAHKLRKIRSNKANDSDKK
ncbi:MAG: hypothetical protein R6W72_07475 [Desulfurivibrionaceae bacterium]